MNLVQLLAFDSLPFTFSSVRIISGETVLPGGALRDIPKNGCEGD